MDAYNNKIFIKNINYLLERENLKIGDFEKSAGLSVGYLSRLAKDEWARPNIDFVRNISIKFDITMDTLMNIDIVDASNSEKLLIKFFDKLIKDTNEDEIIWKKESKNYLENHLDVDFNGNVNHQLMQLNTHKNDDNHFIFYSNNYKEETLIANDCFNLEIEGGTLYLMNIISKTNECLTIEVWLVSYSNGKEFLCDTINYLSLQDLIYKLYSCVELSISRPRLSDQSKQIISSFLDK